MGNITEHCDGCEKIDKNNNCTVYPNPASQMRWVDQKSMLGCSFNQKKHVKEEKQNKKVRVGGMVKEGSIQTSSDQINFIITDFKNEINISFSGAIPHLFAEGKGVVAEGFLLDRNFLNAKKILSKHEEYYMPPEVKEACATK